MTELELLSLNLALWARNHCAALYYVLWKYKTDCRIFPDFHFLPNLLPLLHPPLILQQLLDPFLVFPKARSLVFRETTTLFPFMLIITFVLKYLF